MKIALIGYGKMGHIIEKIALERGHEIVSIIDRDNLDDFESAAFGSADVAIEFTTPATAVANYRRAWAAGVPVVSGTTGWTEAMPTIEDELNHNGQTLFWASNFSLGVNILFELNRHLAHIMNAYPTYRVSLTEIHHTAKKDAPSGTAITLAEEAIAAIDRLERWQLIEPVELSTTSQNTVRHGGYAASSIAADTLPVTALRQGAVPGIHEMVYTSAVDRLSIRHEAFSRDGFALGAVMAAEFIHQHHPTGLLSMHDMLKF